MARRRTVAKADATQAKAAQPNAGLKYIVSVRPGSAACAPLRFRLPEEELEGTVLSAIKYGLAQKYTRSAQEIVASIRREMRGEHGINVNSQTVSPSRKVKPLFREDEKQGIKYMSLDTIVASKQTGGYQ